MEGFSLAPGSLMPLLPKGAQRKIPTQRWRTMRVKMSSRSRCPPIARYNWRLRYPNLGEGCGGERAARRNANEACLGDVTKRVRDHRSTGAGDQPRVCLLRSDFFGLSLSVGKDQPVPVALLGAPSRKSPSHKRSYARLYPRDV